MNLFPLAEQFDRGARLNLPREQGTGVGPRENGDLIRPTEASPGGTYSICPVQPAFAGIAAGGGWPVCQTLSARRAD